MTRKLVALFLVASMLFCMFTGCVSKQETITTVEVDGYDITVKETKNKREASATVEGVSLSCEHIFDTQEYWMYINEEPIELEVTVLEDGIEVYLADEMDTDNLDELVIPQAVLTLSIATPSFITLAKYLFSIVAIGYATDKIVASADSIGTVIRGVRSDTKTYKKYRTIDMSVADALPFVLKNKEVTYES